VRAESVPTIYFALDAAHAAGSIATCGADVLGVDWRTGLGAASRGFGVALPLQGNLDPCALLAPGDVVERRAAEVLDRARGLARGHVFNLGHGILPQTPIASVERLVETVCAHRRSA